MSPEGTFPLRVSQRINEADGVVSLYLNDPEGKQLPSWTPGAHLDLVLPSGLVRQYSLNGSPKNLHEYRIGVLLEAESRGGGSREIHEAPLVGIEIEARGPRNQFPLLEAEGYLFLAGGIGITPILPMLAEVEELGKPWKLVYGARSLSSMAYLGEILAHDGGEVVLVPQDEEGLPDLEAILRSVSAEIVYACGPSPMLGAIELLAETVLAPKRLQLERFTVAESNELVLEENLSFEIELAKSGVTLTVPSDRTMLQVILDEIPSYMWGCEQGYCGTCITDVLDGVPEHRDSCLTDEERSANCLVTPCVSRSKSPRLVLDI